MKTIYNPETKAIDSISNEEYARIHNREIDFNNVKRIVFKAGSDLLDSVYISSLAKQLSLITASGKDVVLVTSGAIKTAQEHIKLHGKKEGLKQAYAAVGQHRLMTKYALAFGEDRIAQNLFTREDLMEENRERYSNARTTLNILLENNIIPIINENDSVAVEEIKLGDNDTLSAYVAKIVEADILVMLSKNGLCNKKPEQGNGAVLINLVPEIDETISGFAEAEASGHGTGGLKTKLAAVRILEQKLPVIVMDGRNFSYSSLSNGQYEGTVFMRKN
jgi:glutamate 5-kinase